MNTYVLVIFLLFFTCLEATAQEKKFSWRFNAAVALSEPDIRGKSLVSELRLGQHLKDRILSSKPSYLDSYFFSIEASYKLSERLEVFGQIGHTVFYDNFPMVVNSAHFSKPGEGVYPLLFLVRDYFNYTVSPSFGLNLSVLDHRKINLLIGTSASYNVTYAKIITTAYGRERSGRGLANGIFFDPHSLESFLSVGISYRKLRLFVDYRYFFAEYRDDATFNDQVPVKYENLTKFRLRLTHDLNWNEGR